MCGITGCMEFPDASSNLGRVYAMTATLHHRGPDDDDVWVDADARLALGHRRLSIIDLTDAGRQPMVSSCGRFVITYNGEIYNAAELRRDLQAAGRSFTGHSDTEVIVEGCAIWGIEGMVDRLIGMFALGIWDRRQKQLTLVRDRLGIKPLYWSFKNGLFLFASELKAFRAAPDFEATINRTAVTSFLRYGYVPAPLSIYDHVQKLEPGTLLSVDADGKVATKPYWALANAVTAGKVDLFQGSDDEAVDALESLLTDAIRRRMIADVPLGA
ncbi:MAG: asparagine synthetase B family protein, partial [Methyloligellaceae bacterium]